MSMINIKQSIMVKPSKETPLKILNLSKLDMIVRAPKTHTNIFYIYERPSQSTPNFDVEILKNALSEILVPFYPLAGRLTMNLNKDRYVIDCNSKGALFVEAETKYRLDEFNNFEPSAKMTELMIPKCDYNRELSAIPLLMVQVTWFKCGGLGLGFAPHHHVADGAAHIDFFAKLMRLAGGSSLTVPPVHDRVYVAPREPGCIKSQHLHEFDPIVPSLPPHGRELSTSGNQNNNTTQSLFKFSKQQILALKQSILSQATKNNQTITTYAAVAGQIWRSTCKARALAYDEEVKLYIPVDGRSRLKNPTVPKGYFGNVLFFTVCVAKAGDIMHKPLWHTASKIHEAIQKMDDDYLRSSIDYLELKNGLPDPLMGAHKMLYPNLLINSWVRLPYYEAEFGWGPPKAVGNCEIKLEGLSFLTSGSNKDEGLTLAINLFSDHMSRFKKYLYNFTSINSKL
ncbi:anthranilate N-benzoyltransferase protein 1-like [Silene latifolia]|uniref:anthranilate N-benzoyltransferase protein 1-like n=1 Tax=Silene latifolia TaxID=37657 RepID=UPI003D7863C0